MAVTEFLEHDSIVGHPGSVLLRIVDFSLYDRHMESNSLEKMAEAI